ncbi:Thiolase, N-terminal domain-containing protein [Dichotomocladium elegans]|nr:Thiolase, N-terminal domain-containing protein [Dichotomocladium elegans]
MRPSLPYPIRLSAAAEAQPTKLGLKDPEDVVVVAAVRTALTKGRKGGLKDTKADELLSFVFKAIITKTGIDPNLVQDICVGNVDGRGGLATPSRMAALAAGFPETTSIFTTNRQCSSGLQACVSIATSIQAGLIDIGIGAGVESMSNDYFNRNRVTSKKIADCTPAAADCLVPMGITSENVAADYGLTRLEQDEFSVLSHQKAAAAQAAGYFKEEIIPVTAIVYDKNGENPKEVLVDQDDGIRANSSVESLSKLKAVFKKDGTTTAGNASQISDGAAAVLLMKRKVAISLGMPILGKYVTSAVVGVPPRIMGVGPAYAIPVAVERAGISLDDVDIYEINEAFASQALYTVRALGIPMEKVNPKGGAIAIGHPLGCTGARQICTLFPELKRTNKRIGITSMCMGSGKQKDNIQNRISYFLMSFADMMCPVGLGMACVWERE